MNDMRRTLLWSVFAFSLLMLWDGWLRHTGQPSCFASRASNAVAGAGLAAQCQQRADSRYGFGLTQPAAASVAAASASPAAVPHELVTITTDVVKATIDSHGGTLVKVELLKHQDQEDKTRNMVCARQDGHSYLCGGVNLVIGQSAGEALPNHHRVCCGVGEIAELAQRADQFTGQAGVGVGERREADQNLYLQARRLCHWREAGCGQRVGDRHPPTVVCATGARWQRAASGTGPRLHGVALRLTPAWPCSTPGQKYQKLDFKHIEEGKTEFEKTDDNGWVAMVQHHFTSAWLNNDKVPREFFTKKIATNLYATGHAVQPG